MAEAADAACFLLYLSHSPDGFSIATHSAVNIKEDTAVHEAAKRIVVARVVGLPRPRPVWSDGDARRNQLMMYVCVRITVPRLTLSVKVLAPATAVMAASICARVFPFTAWPLISQKMSLFRSPIA